MTGNGAPLRWRGGEGRVVDELVLAYLDFAETYYNGGGEFVGMKGALEHLSAMYGDEPGRQFGPAALYALQQRLIQLRYARSFVNKTIGRIKRFFRWCSKHEHVPPLLYHELDAVDPVMPGRYGARETDPVEPVKWDVACQIVPYVSPQIAAMIQVQYLCGMRPQDVCIMRRFDIDTSGDIWFYRPYQHKGTWAGRRMVKAVPKAAQEILKSFFKTDIEAYLFSPKDAWEWQRENRPCGRKDDRKTPIYPSELKSRERRKAETRAKLPPLRPKGDHYTTNTYWKAVQYGILAANRAIRKQLETQGVEVKQGDLVPQWSPNQLRHGIATEIRQVLGQQAAQLWLGHENLQTTGIYAEKELKELMEIARQLDRRWAS